MFEQIITQANANDLTESFVQQGGIEKLLDLTQIQAIAQELSSSTFSNSVANILQYLLVGSSVIFHRQLCSEFRSSRQADNGCLQRVVHKTRGEIALGE